jgi:hypothetical protein
VNQDHGKSPDMVKGFKNCCAFDLRVKMGHVMIMKLKEGITMVNLKRLVTGIRKLNNFCPGLQRKSSKTLLDKHNIFFTHNH